MKNFFKTFFLSKSDGMTAVEVLVMSSLISVFIGLIYYLVVGSFTLVERSSDYSLLLHRINLLAEYLKSDLSASSNVYSVNRGIITLEKPAFFAGMAGNSLTLQRVTGRGAGKGLEFHEIAYEIYPSRNNAKKIVRTDRTAGTKTVIDFSFVPGEVKINVYPVGERKGAFKLEISVFDIYMSMEVFSPYLEL